MDTIQIFGCSDRISELGDEVFDLLKEYPSIGLNRFPEFFPFVDYRLWIDNKSFGNCVYKRNGSLYEPYLPFEPNIDLFGAYTVASFALDFALKQGYKRAVLYGILDGRYQLIEKKGIHAGHWDFSYRHFYEEKPQRIPVQKLQQFKSIIYGYRSKIQLEIPYMTI